MFAQLIITQVTELLNWPFAEALAAMLLITALLACWIYDRIFGMSSIPFTLVTVASVLKTYDIRLNHADATLGASRARTLMSVTIPLIKGGMIAAFLFAFITSFDELTIAIFISGGIKTTLPKQMWNDMILQLNPTLAAVSVVVLVLVTTLLLLAELFRRSPSNSS